MPPDRRTIAVGRRELRAFALGGLLAALLLALVVPPLALLHRQELPLERSLANATVTLVARLSAGSAANPVGPGAHVTDAGRFAYLGSCATCHGAKGDGRGAFGRDTYPDAADLTSPNTVAKTDAELFWIIKNGLAFTAMPGFGRVYPDQNIWELVSYVRALQEGKGTAVTIPMATREQLAFADLAGAKAQRGAAIYLAMACAECHGPIGNAPGELSLAGPSEASAIRGGGLGMPAYPPDRLSEAELDDLLTFVATLRGR
ncbi:MAG: c-type cytochrome [Actinobacteria bacterium]|nr:MAG: c-type cytochrome [Actinomycetota bacterium]